MLESADRHTRVILDLVMDADARTQGMMPGWDLELARQKLLFFTSPEQFASSFDSVSDVLCSKFTPSGGEIRERMIGFVLGIAESLLSPVELHHNLQSRTLHGGGVLSDADAAAVQKKAADIVRDWAAQDVESLQSVTALIKAEDMGVNKGDNLFISWALKWEQENGRDPYANVDDYLACFGRLYQKDIYYPALYFAREEGKTRTQFFNDFGMQAARCRRLGSLGGTTNPVIAVLGEDDLSGTACIWGEDATKFICQFSNKWHDVRRWIAKEQVAQKQTDDWGATKFTEWVVVDAMLGLRSVFLLRGLGRVAFQLRPDWHDDEEKLTFAGAEIYAVLCSRVRAFDDILLDGAHDAYAQTAKPRIGKSNNHFKIACTGRAALNVVHSFNAGRSERFPEAVTERMYTNVTLSYDVPQMYEASLQTEYGIRDYRERTGDHTSDGEGGSVVTSMIGRFNDAIRDYRVRRLLGALPADSPYKSIDPASVKKLTDESVNNPGFIAAANKAGIEFEPEAEEDAIDRAGTLCTKRVVILLERNMRLPRTRILTASKRNFYQNTELLDVPFSTDFGNIQRMYLEHMPLEISNWRTLYDDMDEEGCPVKGSIWEKRHEILSRIWPDWKKSFDIGGVSPDDYAEAIYVKPTLTQFLAMWNENVARAKAFADEARG